MDQTQVKHMGRALRVLGEHADRIEAGDSDGFETELRLDLERALELLEEAITTPPATTRCNEHPRGPVDMEARDLCLLCEMRRRFRIRSTPRPRPADELDDENKDRRMQSAYRTRANNPEAVARWITEMWDGTVWHACGAPRTSREDGMRYTADQAAARPKDAFRLVHAFTDHDIVRTWGDTRNVAPEPPVF
ncbi:hypothetical protein [Streptomyces sp. NPDC085596]|uniref:hypothetical protein n=1 Tax=Streptomyces sp. NPDC085596 TaxID=3365731 RepID=UPI0037D49C0A